MPPASVTRRARRGALPFLLSLLVASFVASSASASGAGVSVWFVGPKPGHALSGNVTWKAAASRATRVVFSIDGKRRWVETRAPYVFAGDGHKLDTRKLQNGRHELTLTAYAKGRVTASAARVFVVRNSRSARGLARLAEPSAIDNTTPADGSVVSGTIRWAVTTTGSVRRVEFAIDGRTRDTDTSAPYVYDGGSLDTTKLANGRHTLTATVTFGSGSRSASKVGIVVANAVLTPPSPSPGSGSSTPSSAPSATQAPTISGVPVVGQSLVASAGVWSGAPTAYAYQWATCTSGTCSPVSGATTTSYSPRSSDVGRTIRVTVSASNGGATGSASSAQTAAVTASSGSSSSPPPGSSPSPPSGSSTDSSSAPSWQSVTAYTQTRPAFTALREIDVTSQSQLANAVWNLKAGDSIKATQPFTVTGEFNILAAPSGPAQIDLTGVRFVGGDGVSASVWIDGAKNLRIFGGDISNPYDYGINVHAGSNVLWWGFTIHDTGGSGLAMLPAEGDITGFDMAGEISHWGGNLAIDDHAEKGTGLHGAILADADGSYVFDNNRLALDVHDGPTGAGVEIGDGDGSQIAGNTLYLRAQHLTEVATQQVGGNALQEWGTSPVGLTVPYLEAGDLTGRAVDENTAHASMSGTVIVYGRATNVCQNTQMNEPLPVTQAWDPRAGVTYENVA